MTVCPTPPSSATRWGADNWMFMDVVFQDVGFQNASLKPLTHVSLGVKSPHLQF